MMFTHLHNHSIFSLVDGKPTPKEIALAAKENGMEAVALTDHGYMYGVIDFYKACKEVGVKPIIGMEAYKASDSVYDHVSSNKKAYHLILLAKNQEGYQNLVKLASFAATDGFWYKPRVDFDHLRQYHEGIICLSACINGEIPRALVEDDYDKAKKLAQEYLDIFGEDFYIELQNHGIEEELKAMPGLIQIAKELNIPVVATNDVHYIPKKDANAQKMLMAIAWKKDKKDTKEGEKPFGYDTPPELYFKSEEEMVELFKDIPEAITNTQVIADKCNVEIPLGKYHMPVFPENRIKEAGYSSADEYFAAMCYEGLKKRYGDDAKKYEEQLEYEMCTIMSMGFADYFLIVSDFIKFAKRNGIYVGPGRGSAAGSMVSYCLEITELEPTHYALVFERFLNPERVTMPDVDIDFEVPEGREAVINYVTETYGADRVCQIITFTTLAGRSAVDDVARVIGTDKEIVEKVKKLIPNVPNVRLGTLINENEALQKLYKSSKDAATLIAYAIKVEGALRQPSKHAAGVIISPEPVTNFIPTCIDSKTHTAISQFYMGSVEATGMIKFDFLGLRNLTILKSAVQAVKEHTGTDIDLNNIPLDDPAVFEMLSKGDVSGVFQLESAGMRSVVMDLKPSNIEDIIAVVALYRPGPMDSIPRFIECKHDPSKVVYEHPALEPILKDTYGCIVYQESVMQILRDLAGYSYGRSDLVRRIMSKKKAEAMAAEKEIFLNGEVDENGKIIVPGALRNGISKEIAEKLWDEMESFASYAFNRAHAACYGFIAYQTAWMKVHYPLEYQAAMMTNAVDNPKKLVKLYSDCEAHKITILRPDINKSLVDFSVEDDGIRYGLVATKGIGRAILDEIVMERSYGPYTGMQNLVERCPLASKKDVLEALIKSGALDGFGQNRAQMLLAVVPMLKLVAKARKAMAKDQLSFEDSFFTSGESAPVQTGLNMEPYAYADVPELSRSELLDGELQSTGMYVSGHPMAEYASMLQGRVTHDLGDLSADDDIDEETEAIADGTQVRVAGILSVVKEHRTKKGQPMAFATMTDQTGSIELTIFPRAYEAVAADLKVGAPVLVFGKVSTETFRDTVRHKLLADSIEFLNKNSEKKD